MNLWDLWMQGISWPAEGLSTIQERTLIVHLIFWISRIGTGVCHHRSNTYELCERAFHIPCGFDVSIIMFRLVSSSHMLSACLCLCTFESLAATAWLVPRFYTDRTDVCVKVSCKQHIEYGVAVADEVRSLLLASCRQFSYEGCVSVATQGATRPRDATRTSTMRRGTPAWKIAEVTTPHCNMLRNVA